MNKEHTTKLVEDFPYLYAGIHGRPMETCMCFGFECGDGWFDLIYNLSKRISESDPEVRAVQVKEKFGGLRFYVNAASDDVYAFIQEAEDLSYETCEVCGNAGKLDATGWHKTSCGKHHD